VFQENDTSLSVDKAMLVYMTVTLWNTKTAVVAFPTSRVVLGFEPRWDPWIYLSSFSPSLPCCESGTTCL